MLWLHLLLLYVIEAAAHKHFPLEELVLSLQILFIS